MSAQAETANLLGEFLRGCRAKLDPTAFGLTTARRRTPGLRREEVAQRANVSATWYTWLEQGRGGAPSADVLDRISRALMLTDVEREHLFLIGLGRPPEVHYRAPEGISPRLQRVIDALEFSPAVVKTPTWDVVAWNPAAAAVLTDYSKVAPEERNVVKAIFLNPRVRSLQLDWESVARFIVAAMRADAARAGASETIKALVDELSQKSPEFAAMWRENDVRTRGDGTKRLRHPVVGLLALEYSVLGVDGRHDLSLIVYNPVTPADAEKIRTLVRARNGDADNGLSRSPASAALQPAPADARRR